MIQWSAHLPLELVPLLLPRLPRRVALILTARYRYFPRLPLPFLFVIMMASSLLIFSTPSLSAFVFFLLFPLSHVLSFSQDFICFGFKRTNSSFCGCATSTSLFRMSLCDNISSVKKKVARGTSGQRCWALFLGEVDSLVPYTKVFCISDSDLMTGNMGPRR